MSPETLTGLLTFGLVVAVVVGATYATLYYRSRTADDLDSRVANQLRGLYVALESARLIPKADEHGRESPLIRATQQLRGLEVLLSDTDVSARLSEFRRQIEQLETIRMAGPTAVQLGEADQQRLDELAQLIPALRSTLTESQERVLRMSHQLETVERLNGLLAENLRVLIQLVEEQRSAEGPNLEQVHQEMARMNGHLVEFIELQRERIAQLAAPTPSPVNEREPLRLLRS